MSVKNEHAQNIKMVTVMKNIVGPFSVLPVNLANHNSAILTGHMRNAVNATHVSRIHRAVSPDVALTRATASASRLQPTTSLHTPADRTTTPTVVSRSCSAVRIRQRTGKAVIENDTPVKSMKYVNLTEEGMKLWYSGKEIAEPRAKDKAMAESAMNRDERTLRLIMLPSISRPTIKRKRQRPMLATSERYGRD